MGLDRRGFLKHLTAIGSTAVVGKATKALAHEDFTGYPNSYGVLVDTTVCIGCRKCEWACKNANNLPNKPITEYNDKSVFETIRRTHADSFTVVNRFENSKNPDFILKNMRIKKPKIIKNKRRRKKSKEILSFHFIQIYFILNF